MSTAAVMLVKDEADIIGPVLRHLLEEVDAVIVADNGSTDGTREIVAAFAGAGNVQLHDDPEPGYYQSAKTSRLARLAYQQGHTWVIPVDADELWYSPHGRIADVLARQSRGFIFASVPLIYHLPAVTDPPDETDPIERIGWRFRDEHQPSNVPKVACRLSADLEISMGNHSASGFGKVHSNRSHTVHGLLVIRHFPWRSEEQFLRKITNGARAYAAAPDLAVSFGEHWRAFGMPEDPGFKKAVRSWYRQWGYSGDPRSRDDLIHDPAYGALAARAHTIGG